MTSKNPSTLKEADLERRKGSRYPPEFAKHVAGRSSVSLGDPFGLGQFGVNIVTLEPGAWSSHRHWHEKEDELAYALEGEMVLVDDHGRHAFLPGMCAGFRANNGNGHQILNESSAPARFLVVGSRMAQETVHYSDIDMQGVKTGGSYEFTRRDGSKF